jgi:hypothetical protein
MEPTKGQIAYCKRKFGKVLWSIGFCRPGHPYQKVVVEAPNYGEAMAKVKAVYPDIISFDPMLLTLRERADRPEPGALNLFG